MRVADLRAGDRFIFDGKLGECCAVGDAIVTDSGDVDVMYTCEREIRLCMFGPSVEVDLVSRTKHSAGIVRL
jgi:hypothetical protein